MKPFNVSLQQAAKQCKIALCWLIAMWCLLANVSYAALVDVPPLNARVTDLTATLNPEQTNQLEAKLTAFEHEKGSQIAVLIVPTTLPEDITQYSIRVVDAWKIGRAKQDDGVLLLIAKDDRKIRIEVGYGLEGAIPDLIAKRIITEIISPSFKAGDFYGGIDGALTQMMALVSGEQLAPPTPRDAQGVSIESLLPFLLIGSLILGGLLKAIFGDFLGGALNGGAIGLLAWVLGGGLLMAILFGFVAFIITLMGLAGLGHLGGLGGGSYGGRGSGGFDPFSGGGGGFGGGGASGDW